MHWLDKLGSAPRAPSPTPPRGAACSTASAACSSAPPSSCRCCRWRARRQPPPKPQTDETACDYWRYCAVDGFLCSCCGGSMTSCPPGTSPSAVSWVGTCHNPLDGKDYLISYNDCCGKTACGKCMCAAAERERPGYQMFLHNDVNWCMSNESSIFHCTTSVIVGLAKPKP